MKMICAWIHPEVQVSFILNASNTSLFLFQEEKYSLKKIENLLALY